MKPRILCFDLETTGTLKAHMGEVITFGYKWLHEKKAHILSSLDFDTPFYDDKPLLEQASMIYNSADVVVAHYGERFDRRFLNTRIEKHGLPPLKRPMRLIDTWRISKDNFALPGNSLNTLLKFFNSPFQKYDLTYEEWRGVMLGEVACIKKLNKHCYYDVLGLEWVFLKHLAHYTNKLPNYNLFVDEEYPVCPQCGGSELEKRGYAYKESKKWRRYFCKGCCKWSEGPMKGVVR